MTNSRRYNKAAKPIRWIYRNAAHRISSTSADTAPRYDFVRFRACRSGIYRP